MDRVKPLPDDLRKLKKEICEYAKNYGLTFFDVEFEMCDYDTVNVLAAQGGFPTRYPHWRFGMDYDQFSKGYAYGVQKIYEMVINTDPCYAYLLNANHTVDQKIVMAHVYGHADFFKNNYWFNNTDRKMMDTMANHRTKIRRYMEQFGADEVELFIDKVLSLENLIDINDLFETPEVVRHRKEIDEIEYEERSKDTKDKRSDALRSFMKSSVAHKKGKEGIDCKGSGERGGNGKRKGSDSRGKSDTDDFDGSGTDVSSRINRSADTLHSGSGSSGGAGTSSSGSVLPHDHDQGSVHENIEMKKFPARPVRDILKFLAEYAPISEWQSDIISILRDEAYYFLPQRMTKIMNEGWASYWHSKIMTEKALSSSEIVDFADHHAGVMQMSKKSLNPYKLGIELFRDIEYRWNTGKFGKEYNDCDNLHEKEQWDLQLNEGRKKIFEVRRTHDDISFIDEFLTMEFCERHKMFTYKFNQRTNRFEIDNRDFSAIKMKLLTSLTNFGSPIIEISDANYANRGELLLVHRYYGVDLDINYAHETMKNIWGIWKRPINLSTKYDGKEVIFVYDGRDFKPLT